MLVIISNSNNSYSINVTAAVNNTLCTSMLQKYCG